MKAPGNDLLLIAGKSLTLLIQGVMALAGGVVLLVMVALPFYQDSINADGRIEFGPGFTDLPLAAVLALLALISVLCALVFLFFGKLRGIIDTVAAGDPFVPENADRLSAMGWILIGIYALTFVTTATAAAVSAWAAQFTEISVKGGLEVDVMPVMMILVLFILARVFKHGAAMREDLEGTV
jgi:hypothetical protein